MSARIQADDDSSGPVDKPEESARSVSRGYAWNKAWRERHPDRRHRWKAAYRARTGSGTAPRGGERWTDDEERAVMQHAIPDRELAEQLGRSVQAIAVRRDKIVKRQAASSRGDRTVDGAA